MSEGEAKSYRLDQLSAVVEQIRTIAAAAKQRDKLDQFITVLKQAAHQLQTDPHGWGDPEYRSASSDGIVCHGIIRPVVFHYVVYESVRSVVLLSVAAFADFV